MSMKQQHQQVLLFGNSESNKGVQTTMIHHRNGSRKGDNATIPTTPQNQSFPVASPLFSFDEDEAVALHHGTELTRQRISAEDSFIQPKSLFGVSPSGDTQKKDDESSSCCIDKDRIFQALQNTGRHANGISVMEVWVLSHSSTPHLEDGDLDDSSNSGTDLLIQSNGGWWCSPSFRKGLCQHSSMAEMLNRFENSSLTDSQLLRVERVGTGLAGKIWTEMYMEGGAATGDGRLDWRHIGSLHLDPDQPAASLRSRLYEELGLTHAAGVPFDVYGARGLILYLTTSNHPNQNMNDYNTSLYLKRGAALVGAAASLSSPRKRLQATIHTKTSTLHNNAASEKEPVVCNPREQPNNKVMQRISSWASKCASGSARLQPPPPMSTNEAFFTFVGSFLMLLVLALTSDAIRIMSNGRIHGIELGPFGALATLQYGLTMAPASQPRNVIYGFTIAVSIALVFSSVASSIPVPFWFQVPLATATAIAVLVRLGLTHPPAGAAAWIVAASIDRYADEGDADRLGTRRFTWVDLIGFVFGGVLSVGMAIMINNWSHQRHYPTYWKCFGSSTRTICHSRIAQAMKGALQKVSTYFQCLRKLCTEAVQNFNSADRVASSSDTISSLKDNVKQNITVAQVLLWSSDSSSAITPCEKQSHASLIRKLYRLSDDDEDKDANRNERFLYGC